MRTKYAFKSRQDAESAHSRMEHNRNLLAWALDAVLNGETIPVDGKWGKIDGCYYTFRLIARRFDTIVLVSFHSPETGQRDHTTVYDSEWVQEEIDRYTRNPPYPSDLCAIRYREGLYEVRRKIAEIESVPA